MENYFPLTPKQDRFVREFLVDGNGSAAAVRAGYGAAGAKVAASRLLTKDNVQKALRAQQSEDATRLSLARNDVLAGLLEAVDAARLQKNPMAMIRGWAEVGKMLGFYATGQLKVDLNLGGLVDRGRMNQLSDSELLEIVEVGRDRPD